MENIISFISNVKNIPQLNSYDEEATKTSIVLQLLSLLGWNIFSRDEVFPERTSQGKKVDYSLRYNNKDLVFIEVKRIKEDLNRHQEQILHYAFQEGVNLAILTNGLTWWFYLPIMDGNWESRKFYTIELNERNPEEIAKKFIDLLSKENIISGKALKTARYIYEGKQKKREIKKHLPEAWEKIINEPDEILVDLIAEKVESLCGFTPSAQIVQNFIKNIYSPAHQPLPQPTLPRPPRPSDGLNALEGLKVFLKSKVDGTKINAEGIIVGKGIRVLKNSYASISHTDALNSNYVAIRKKLKDDGILREQNDKLKFYQDYLFDHPSPAACVICGNSRNGKDNWEDINGQSINDLEKSIVNSQ